MGSWPRPRWLLRSLHQHLEARLGDAEFEKSADDAVRLAVDAQVRASTDVLTDGEQRRDNYASFVGGLPENCQLVPVTDLLPYVDDPEEFERELASLDVPAGQCAARRRSGRWAGPAADRARGHVRAAPVCPTGR